MGKDAKVDLIEEKPIEAETDNKSAKEESPKLQSKIALGPANSLDQVKGRPSIP